MDDLADEELEGFLFQLRSKVERRRSMVSSSEDIAGTDESLEGQWGEWMCTACGIFMKEQFHHCRRCGVSRI